MSAPTLDALLGQPTPASAPAPRRVIYFSHPDATREFLAARRLISTGRGAEALQLTPEALSREETIAVMGEAICYSPRSPEEYFDKDALREIFAAWAEKLRQVTGDSEDVADACAALWGHAVRHGLDTDEAFVRHVLTVSGQLFSRVGAGIRGQAWALDAALKWQPNLLVELGLDAVEFTPKRITALAEFDDGPEFPLVRKLPAAAVAANLGAILRAAYEEGKRDAPECSECDY